MYRITIIAIDVMQLNILLWFFTRRITHSKADNLF